MKFWEPIAQRSSSVSCRSLTPVGAYAPGPLGKSNSVSGDLKITVDYVKSVVFAY